MSLARSHYEILGVSRTATAREIRAAYLRLMKQYHPDAAQTDDGAAAFAPILNLCYAVLKDPATRAQYDAELMHGSDALIIDQQLDDPALQRSTHRWTIILFAIALGVVILVSMYPGSERRTRELFAAAAGWVSSRSPPTSAVLSHPVPDAAETRRIADIARELSARDAERFSRQCFTKSAQSLNASLVDSCVLFDVAFLYWQRAPTRPASSSYFADQIVNQRHHEVMNAFGLAAEKRLSALRQGAFLALIEGLKESRPAPAGQTSVRDPGPPSDQVQAGARERLAQAGVP